MRPVPITHWPHPVSIHQQRKIQLAQCRFPGLAISNGSVLNNNDGDIEMFTRNTMKQVRAQLHTSADNAALPTFARRDATAAARLLLTAGRAAIDRYLLLAGPTAANPPSGVRRMGQTDGRTVGRATLA